MSVAIINDPTHPLSVSAEFTSSSTSPIYVTTTQALPVLGTVTVSNLPTTQVVSGTVSVSNFPTTQSITGSVVVASGSVSVSNFPTTVSISNLPTTQNVSGTVTVSSFPTTYPVTGTVSVDNFPVSTAINNLPNDYPISGIVTVDNLYLQSYADMFSAPTIQQTYSLSGVISESFSAPSATVQSKVTTIKARGSEATLGIGSYSVEMTIDAPPLATTSTSGSIVLAGVLSVDSVNTTNIFTHVDGDFNYCTSLGSSNELATFFRVVYIPAVPDLGQTTTVSMSRVFTGVIQIAAASAINIGAICASSGTHTGTFAPIISVNIRKVF